MDFEGTGQDKTGQDWTGLVGGLHRRRASVWAREFRRMARLRGTGVEKEYADGPRKAGWSNGRVAPGRVMTCNDFLSLPFSFTSSQPSCE